MHSVSRLSRSIIGHGQLLRNAAGPSASQLSSLQARRWLSEASRAKLDKVRCGSRREETSDSAVAANPVVLFMKGTPEVPQCGFSRAAIQVLEMSNVPQDKIKTYNVLADDELRTDIKEYSFVEGSVQPLDERRSWPTIPQLYVNGEFIGGCDILLSQYKDGSLGEMFAKEGIVKAERA